MEKTEYMRSILHEILIEYINKNHYTNKKEVYKLIREV